MGRSLIRVLFCDYAEKFHFGSDLSRLGFSVDEVKPQGLKHVGLNDHEVYIFAFNSETDGLKAVTVCNTLKSAGLKTPIILLNEGSLSSAPGVQNPPDAWVNNTENKDEGIVEALKNLVGLPVAEEKEPTSEEEWTQRLRPYLDQIQQLKEELQQLKDHSAEAPKPSAERPTLKALLENQKAKLQTESERLTVALAEVQAKLMEREAKVLDLEAQLAKLK